MPARNGSRSRCWRLHRISPAPRTLVALLESGAPEPAGAIIPRVFCHRVVFSRLCRSGTKSKNRPTGSFRRFTPAGHISRKPPARAVLRDWLPPVAFPESRPFGGNGLPAAADGATLRPRSNGPDGHGLVTKTGRAGPCRTLPISPRNPGKDRQPLAASRPRTRRHQPHPSARAPQNAWR